MYAQGHIGHDTLSNMIRQDEAAPLRARRRHLYYLTYHDLTAKYAYPSDAMQVGCWIKDQYGPRSHVTAIFMTHAVINENHEVRLSFVLVYIDGKSQGVSRF